MYREKFENLKMGEFENEGDESGRYATKEASDRG